MLAVTLGSEQAMKATEEAAYWLRVFSALLAYRGAIFKNAQSAKEALVLESPGQTRTEHPDQIRTPPP